jgi:hypothetical protein
LVLQRWRPSPPRTAPQPPRRRARLHSARAAGRRRRRPRDRGPRAAAAQSIRDMTLASPASRIMRDVTGAGLVRTGLRRDRLTARTDSIRQTTRIDDSDGRRRTSTKRQPQAPMATRPGPIQGGRRRRRLSRIQSSAAGDASRRERRGRVRAPPLLPSGTGPAFRQPDSRSLPGIGGSVPNEFSTRLQRPPKSESGGRGAARVGGCGAAGAAAATGTGPADRWLRFGLESCLGVRISHGPRSGPGPRADSDLSPQPSLD